MVSSTRSVLGRKFRWSAALARALAATGILVADAGCAELSTLDEDTCGNGVVEPDVGEDCDGEERCGSPDSEHACRFLCEPSGEVPCEQPGASCGADGVCRTPKGTFELLSADTTITSLDLFTGDINGDGCHEVIHTTRRGTLVTAFESRAPGLCPSSTQELPTGNSPPSALSLPSPVLSDITLDGSPDLLRPGKGLFQDGLFVHVGGGAPEVATMLYPTVRALESLGLPMRITYYGQDALLLLLDDAGGMGQVGIAAVVNPILRPVNTMLGIPGKLTELAIRKVGDLGPVPNGMPGAPCDSCEELVIAAAGATSLEIYTPYKVLTGPPGNMTEEMRMSLSPTPVSLGGPKVRSRNASLAIEDFNGDGIADLLVNADDAELHIAYGVGDGRFHSKLPVDAVTPDMKMGVFQQTSPPQVGDQDFQFLAAKIGGPGPMIFPVPCLPSPVFDSPACGPIEGGCEAVVVDIDHDGLLDIVSTEEQQPGITVRRFGPDGASYLSFADTQCPPHHLTTGDFDNDGIDDVAFFDQVTTGAIGKGDILPVTALSVMHGVASSAPSDPVVSGRFESAVGLTSGHFAEDSAGSQLYAARQTPKLPHKIGFALVEGYADQQLFAPFYFPKVVTNDPGMSDASNLLLVKMLSAAAGHFAGTPFAPPDGLAMITRRVDPQTLAPLPGTETLWNITGNPGGSNLTPASSAGTLDPCDACVLAAVDVYPPGKDARDGVDELVMLGKGEMIVYSMSPDAKPDDPLSAVFEERDRYPLGHDFSAIERGVMPEKYAPRPLVVDLDRDGVTDILAREDKGALVVLWGNQDGSFDEQVLVPPPTCEDPSKACGGLSATLLDLDADSVRDLLVIGPGQLTFFAIHGRELTPLSLSPDDPLLAATPKSQTDFTAVSAADLDGDGVTDLAIVPTSGAVLTFRGLPVRP